MNKKSEPLGSKGVDGEFRIVSGNAHSGLMKNIAGHLGEDAWVKARVSKYPDGEIGVKIKDTVRGKNVWVGQPVCRSPGWTVNDNLVALLLLIDALVRASARRVKVFVPYYGYARQDRKEQGRVPISAKLVANLLIIAGADRILTYVLHAGQIQGFFDIPVDNLIAEDVLAPHIVENFPVDNLVIVAPDFGSAKLARKLSNSVISYVEERFDKNIDIPIAVVEKKRKSDSDVEVMNLKGNVDGKVCILVDDIISTFGTINEAAGFLLKRGGAEVHAIAAHGIFVEKAQERLGRDDCPVQTVTVTDTVPPDFGNEKLSDKLKARINRVSIAEHAAGVIYRIENHLSVSALFPHT